MDGCGLLCFGLMSPNTAHHHNIPSEKKGVGGVMITEGGVDGGFSWTP